MLIVYGKRNLRIKKYADHSHPCSNCKAFDLEIKVYKTYCHVFFIPFFPIGPKMSVLKCNSCGQQLRMDSLQGEYEKKTRNPFYLYSGLILIGGLILLIVNESISKQKEKKQFVQEPQAGDVYFMREEIDNKPSYYFLRIASVEGDSVIVYHGNLMYNGYLSKPQKEDYFVKDDKLIYAKSELVKMLEKDEINSVERNYRNEDGFDRIK
jgi:hypothetical protein